MFNLLIRPCVFTSVFLLRSCVSLPVVVCFPPFFPCNPVSPVSLVFYFLSLFFCLVLLFVGSSVFHLLCFTSCLCWLSLFFLPSTHVCNLFICLCVIKSLCFIYSSFHPTCLLCSHVVLRGFCLSSVFAFFCCLHFCQLFVEAHLLLFNLPLMNCDTTLSEQKPGGLFEWNKS